MLTAVSSSSPLKRPAVERLDVDQLVRELVAPRVDAVVRQGVEHERVVGVGAVADADELFGLRGGHADLGDSRRVAVNRRPSAEGRLVHVDAVNESARKGGGPQTRAARSRLERREPLARTTPAARSCGRVRAIGGVGTAGPASAFELLAGQLPGFAVEGEQLRGRVERRRRRDSAGRQPAAGRRRRTPPRAASRPRSLPTATLRTSSSTMSSVRRSRRSHSGCCAVVVPQSAAACRPKRRAPSSSMSCSSGCEAVVTRASR